MPTPAPSLLDRFRGALLGTAVGDALGAPFEGQPRASLADVAAVMDADDQLRWTDDTHMTIGVAESLIARGDFDGPDMAQRFVDHHDAEPWRGYGAGPPRIFAAIRAGASWNEPARNIFGGTGSYGNGGAMRAAPAGLARYGNIGGAAALGRDCASITHSHELGLQGAALQAAAVAWLADGASPAQWPSEALVEAIRPAAPAPEYQQQLDKVLQLSADAPAPDVSATLGNGITAVEAVPAALWAFVANPQSFADTITAAILLGGDTDTIAAMAGALCGTHLGEKAIPARWRNRVEARGRLLTLADQLHGRAHRPLSAIPPG